MLQVRSVFATLDTNHDGRLSLLELGKALEWTAGSAMQTFPVNKDDSACLCAGPSKAARGHRNRREQSQAHAG